MTRKDYEKIAQILLQQTESAAHNTQRECARICIAEDLADMFADDNPRFDRDKFLIACGIEG